MKLTLDMTGQVTLLETWTVHTPQGIDGQPHTDEWSVSKNDQGYIIVANITVHSFVTSYTPEDDWRKRLTRLVCYYLRGNVDKIVADGEVKPGITAVEWFAKEYT